MLILTRRIGETVVIGEDDIRFTVLGIKGNQVRLGILAPLDISVHREEIFLKIQDRLNADGWRRDDLPSFARKRMVQEKKLDTQSFRYTH